MNATVREIMQSPVETIDVDATLQDAAKLMREHGVGFLPVVDEKRLVGVLTDRDIAVRAVSYGVPTIATPVRDIATREVVAVHEDQPISVAEQLMTERLVRRVVVLDREDHAVGVVSLDDLARSPGAQTETGRVLEQIDRPMTRA